MIDSLALSFSAPGPLVEWRDEDPSHESHDSTSATDGTRTSAVMTSFCHNDILLGGINNEQGRAMIRRAATLDPLPATPAEIQSPLAVSLALLFTLIVLLLPLAVAKYPALVDFPNHLARHYIGASIDSSAELQRYYSYQWRPVPNMAGDVIFMLLNVFFPPLESERIIVAIAIAAWVIAPFVLNRAIWGKWSIAPSLCGLLVFNNSLRGGLENFLIASALSVLAFALWIHWRDRSSVGRIIVFTVLASLIYFGHFMAWIVLGLFIGPYELQRAITGEGPRLTRLGRLAAAAVPFLPGILLFWTLRLTARTTGDFATLYGGFESRMYAIISPFLMYHVVPDLLALIVVFGVLAWRALMPNGRIIHPSLVYVLIALFIASLFAPAVVQDTRGVHVRLPAILLAVLIASIDWQHVERWRWRAIGAAFVIALVVRSGSITSYWLKHTAEVNELRKSFEKLDRGAAVLSAVNGRADTGEFHWFSLSYAVLDRQIFTSSLYPDVHNLSVKPEYMRLTRLVASPVELSQLPPFPHGQRPELDKDAYWLTWWKDFSHILVLSGEPVELHFKDCLELISEGSFFRLYKVQPRTIQCPFSPSSSSSTPSAATEKRSEN